MFSKLTVTHQLLRTVAVIKWLKEAINRQLGQAAPMSH
jgi:hypothetical protein